VGRNLVLNYIGPNQMSRQMPSASSRPDPLYGNGIARPLDNTLYPLLDGSDGLPRISQVGMGDNPVFPVGEDDLGRNGSHIDS
jgi:hypothetical protein